MSSAVSFQLLKSDAAAGAAVVDLWEICARSAGHAEYARAGAVYAEEWGRYGDAGVLARSTEGRVLGAAWARRLGSEGPGWISDEVPEIMVAVVDDAQGQGLGSRLVKALVQLLALAQVSALSALVPAGSGCEPFFASFGFTEAGQSELGTLLICPVAG